jgi:integrase
MIEPPPKSMDCPVSLVAKVVFRPRLSDANERDTHRLPSLKYRANHAVPFTSGATRPCAIAMSFRSCTGGLPGRPLAGRSVHQEIGSEPAPTIRFLTLKQIDEQLDALADDVKYQAMTATLIYAGLRREELLWLTPDDFDWSSGRHGLIRVRAKTVKDEFWQPKTKVNRAVPISSRLRHFLDKWRLKRSTGAWFFPNSAGGRFDPDNFNSDLRELNKTKGLRWTCLEYRHTFGSQLAMKGESHYKISKLMGNSPEICRRHYAALIPEEMGDSVKFAKPAPSGQQKQQITSA